ncbi:MAG: hypothetical protein K2M93_01990 [Muribaculaceae bacterium]|nr:hypothetical protein [Muribaculaceae bacterium]
MASPRLLSNLLLLIPLSAFAQIDEAIVEHSSTLPSLTESAWNNPALLSEKYESSLSSVAGSFYNSDKERFGEFKADSYMKLKSITISAHALYNNGAKHNVRFCENVDIDKIYPYLTYDAVGGNLNLERYAFGGEIGVKISDRWDAGGFISYNAGLFYRNVDPRPRIVTGDFKLGAGGAYSLNDNYKVGLYLNFDKYKQSCGITFMSELGASKIYHLTGLGSHYNRFAGLGNSTYYNGNSFGGAVTLLPSTEGIYANVSAHKGKMNLILEDLNKLPMSKIDTRDLSIEAGYKSKIWGVTAFTDILRKHGYENIFGDAASGQYPQIGTVAMHIINQNIYGVKGTVDLPIKRTVLSVTPAVGYSHYKELYRDPKRLLKCDNLTSSVEMKAISVIANRVIVRGGIKYNLVSPVTHDIVNVTTNNDDLTNYISILQEGYETATGTCHNFSASIGADLMICSNKYVIGIDATYVRDKLYGNHSLFSASFKF